MLGCLHELQIKYLQSLLALHASDSNADSKQIPHFNGMVTLFLMQVMATRG